MMGIQTKIRINMIIGGICKPVSMIINYLYIPMVLNYLGVEKYGIWSTILTILSWISYFDIGIGNGLRNRLTESLSKKDGQSRKLVSSAYVFIAGVMIIIAVIFSVIALFTNWNKVFGVTNVNENLTVIVIISIIFVAFNFVLSICKNVLYAMQRAAYVSLMELAIQIANLIGVMVMMQYFHSNLFIMAVVYGLSMIFVNFVTSIIIYFKNLNVRPGVFLVDIKCGKSLINVGFQFFIIQVCTLILFTTDSFIISYMYGASSVTPYSTLNKIFGVISGIYAALISPIWSAVSKAKTEQKYIEVSNLIKNMRKLIIPFVCISICLMFVFKPIMRLWLGQDLIYSVPLILFGCFYCALSMWTNMHGAVANGLGILKEQLIMAVIQAVINFPLSFLGAKIVGLGTAGILLGTDLSLLISCIYLPLCIEKKISKYKCLIRNNE